jgi:hypothetical protein
MDHEKKQQCHHTEYELKRNHIWDLHRRHKRKEKKLGVRSSFPYGKKPEHKSTGMFGYNYYWLQITLIIQVKAEWPGKRVSYSEQK